MVLSAKSSVGLAKQGSRQFLYNSFKESLLLPSGMVLNMFHGEYIVLDGFCHFATLVTLMTQTATLRI